MIYRYGSLCTKAALKKATALDVAVDCRQEIAEQAREIQRLRHDMAAIMKREREVMAALVALSGCIEKLSDRQ